jgi:hypothetical protein
MAGLLCDRRNRQRRLHVLSPERLPISEHERAVRAVESWVVRRLLIGANTRGYGKVFVDALKAAAHEVKIAGTSVAEAVMNVLRGNHDRLSWPSDQDLTTAFATRKVYGNMTQERIRMVLGAIDQYLQQANPKTEPAVFHYDKLQIEHIMPQAWRDHWPLTSTDDADQLRDSQRRDQAIHQWGNLTLQ